MSICPNMCLFWLIVFYIFLEILLTPFPFVCFYLSVLLCVTLTRPLPRAGPCLSELLQSLPETFSAILWYGTLVGIASSCFFFFSFPNLCILELQEISCFHRSSKVCPCITLSQTFWICIFWKCKDPCSLMRVSASVPRPAVSHFLLHVMSVYRHCRILTGNLSLPKL